MYNCDVRQRETGTVESKFVFVPLALPTRPAALLRDIKLKMYTIFYRGCRRTPVFPISEQVSNLGF